ncbi:MAG: DUF2089 domain-containing protein [Halanaerobiales bacterium]|nr:DUF2089 domain-containing protein [Halanaerobiales bacterium]
MINNLVGNCPVCGDDMIITSLKCPSCQTSISGNFKLDKFSKLKKEHLEFIEVFVKSRGNIKEVERELGISYPTVRNKLDEVIHALGHDIDQSPDDEMAEKRKEILAELENGDITAAKAVQKLGEI